jgi:hypothetical protein
MLRLRRSVVRLGFRSSQEALGWYVYVAACASIMSDKDPDFNKVGGMLAVQTQLGGKRDMQQAAVRCAAAQTHEPTHNEVGLHGCWISRAAELQRWRSQ